MSIAKPRMRRVLLLFFAICAASLVAACASAPAAAPPPMPTEAARPAEPTKPTAPAPSPANAPSAAPAAGSVADRLRAATSDLDAALTAVGAGDLAKAQQSYAAYDQGWDSVEDDVKAKSPAAYKAIEDAMDDVKAALTKADTPDSGKARDALTKLKQTIENNLVALR